jgi:predicted transposase/invertase (TIGR01784 family)
MKRYLDPKADVVFKKVFGEHPHLLKSFLNAVLPLPDDRPIISLEYLSAENTPVIPAMKKTIADVRCTDTTGRVFIVEMQIDWIDSFKQRLLFESGQALVKQLKKGEAYHLIKPVYGLGLIAVNFDPTPQWYHHYQLVNVDKTPREVIEHLQLIFIELKKFPVHSAQEKQLRLLWLRFMREINEKTKFAPEDLQSVPEIQEALSLVEESAYTEGELLAYEDYWNAVSTEKTMWSGRYQEGEAKGLAEGKAKGLAEGIEKGRIEKAEALQESRLQMAKHMLDEKIAEAVILKITGLSFEELDVIKEKKK